MIEDYHFGIIKIDQKVYNYDVEVRWNGEVLKWSRQQSHIINVLSLERAVNQNPDFIVIGIGYYGMAKVLPEAKEAMEKANIQYKIVKTQEAVRIFNQFPKLFPKVRKIIGCFHLTC